jgi:carbonic anhydrase
VRVETVVTAQLQKEMTPASVLADLQQGNQRFVQDRLTARDYLAQVRATRGGQHPKAIVLSCIDSRVVPELVFDQGIGDLAVARVAGNFENTDILGSMELGAKLAGSRLIVVLGHGGCEAVESACDGFTLGNLAVSLENLAPALDASEEVPGRHDSRNRAYVDAVVEANVRQTVRDILDLSPVIDDLVIAGRLAVVGAVYDVATGRVRWLGERE